MEENLISKKELLELSGISYGQLYRWKRKGLIPEDWFIRKSTFTGQETFFPRGRILNRIEKIKGMKEDLSLDDLAEMFTPALENLSLSPGEIVKRSIVSQDGMKIFLELAGNPAALDLSGILRARILDGLIISGEIGLEEGKSVLEVLGEGLKGAGEEPGELLLIRKLGVFFCLMVSPPCRLFMDTGARLIRRIPLSGAIEELKCKLV